MKYINAIIDEDAPIELNKRMTIAAERKWMKETLAGMRKGTRHFLLAELDGQLVGEMSIS